MSELEERLQRAAADVRDAAGKAVPRPINHPAPSRWRWRTPVLAVLGAAAVVAIVLGVASLLRPPATVDVIGPTPTGSNDPDSGSAGCPPDDLEPPAPQPELPPAVAELREKIIAAALACDADALSRLAGRDFSSSYGSGRSGVFAEAVESGDPLLANLMAILSTPGASVTSSDQSGSVFWIWPAAAIHESWEEIPQADIDALRSIYTVEELELLEDMGRYIGWQTGIRYEPSPGAGTTAPTYPPSSSPSAVSPSANWAGLGAGPN